MLPFVVVQRQASLTCQGWNLIPLVSTSGSLFSITPKLRAPALVLTVHAHRLHEHPPPGGRSRNLVMFADVRAVY